jgi:predicted membrane protein
MSSFINKKFAGSNTITKSAALILHARLFLYLLSNIEHGVPLLFALCSFAMVFYSQNSKVSSFVKIINASLLCIVLSVLFIHTSLLSAILKVRDSTVHMLLDYRHRYESNNK